MTHILAIDGHFGLCRKKSAGKSVRPPLHDGVYFEPQEKVDTFVQSYSIGREMESKVVPFIIIYRIAYQSLYSTLLGM